MNGEQQQFVITGKLTIEEKKKDGRETYELFLHDRWNMATPKGILYLSS